MAYRLGNRILKIDNKLFYASGVARPNTCIYSNLSCMKIKNAALNFGAKTVKTYSLAHWVKTSEVGGTSPNRYNEFMGFGDSQWRSFFRLYETASSTKSHYWFNVPSGNYIDIAQANNNYTAGSGAWHFLATSFDDTNNILDFYVYNTSGFLMSGHSATWTANPYNANDYWTLGATGRYRTAHKQYYNSTGFWNKALTASEVLQLWNNGAGLSYANLDAGLKTNLMAWWNCDNLDGSYQSTDSTGNGYTIVGENSNVSLVAV